jgi:hypothetical protein
MQTFESPVRRHAAAGQTRAAVAKLGLSRRPRHTEAVEVGLPLANAAVETGNTSKFYPQRRRRRQRFVVQVLQTCEMSQGKAAIY